MISFVVSLSFFSGFHSFPVPFDLAWQFSPLGLLQGVKPENLELESHGYFSNSFGFTYDYLIVFLKTCICESPFYFICFRKEPFLKFMKYLIAANLLTHPIVFFVIPVLFDKYITSALVAEAYAAVGEMIFVAILLSRKESKMTVALGVLLIALANLFSWEVGMFV